MAVEAVAVVASDALSSYVLSGMSNLACFNAPLQPFFYKGPDAHESDRSLPARTGQRRNGGTDGDGVPHGCTKRSGQVTTSGLSADGSRRS